MADKFSLFRFSLLPREQMDILNFPDKTREQYLRSLFSSPFNFTHYGNDFHYAPSLNISDSKEYIVGRIGRSVILDENLPPDVGLEETQRSAWKASFVVIDPTEHPDGQKVSFEEDNQVGKPQSILASLVNTINQKDLYTPYHLEVAPIFDARSFWDWANENEGNVTTITFTFVAPNMFGGSDEITEEMRRFRDEEKAQKVKVQMISDEALDTNTDRVRESVEYTTRGGGEITARSRKGRPYNSKRQIASIILEDTDDEYIQLRVNKNIMRILGRE